MGAAGYVHQALLYGDDDELLAAVVPFVERGVADGEPTTVSLDPRLARMVRAALDPAVRAGVVFVPNDQQYDRPASTIRATRETFDHYLAGGAPRIRVVGAVPHPGTGAAWQPWARYEAFANEAFARYPLWALCPYDTRTTPPSVLEDALLTHTHVATSHQGCHRNPRFQDPVAFLRDHLDYPDEPIEHTAPDLLLVDPAVVEARHALAHLAAATELDDLAIGGLITSVSEVTTNARIHGGPPVVVRAWAERDRILVSVSDCGPGPADPHVGLTAVDRSAGEGGIGLWLVHQLCDEVTMRRNADGFRIRLTVRC